MVVLLTPHPLKGVLKKPEDAMSLAHIAIEGLVGLSLILLTHLKCR